MSNDLFTLGAEPIDLMAARLLWKSPLWAKILELTEEPAITLPEEDFVTVVAVLQRDFRRFNKRKVMMEDFADLASVARKIRWKNLDEFRKERQLSSKISKKLRMLRWNPATCRFEFDPSAPLSVAQRQNSGKLLP